MSKTADELKKDRTVAKRAFSRLANTMIRTYKDKSVADLEGGFNAIAKAAERVWEANDDLEAKLLTDKEDELDTEEAAVLSEHQKADLEKTAVECEETLNEVRCLVQQALWSNAGEHEVLTALQVAEAEGRRTAAVDLSSRLEAYEFMLDHLQKLAKAAKESFERWKRWAPSEQRQDIQDRLKDLNQQIPVCISRKADFICQKLKEDQHQAAHVSQIPVVPAIRLKPTALPKFSGNKRDFHRWRKDWEALQKQGEPSGSKEVKKFQLLGSLEERVTRDLRLTSYQEADDLFRVLENRFGNRTAIAIEIVEELQRIPAVKNQQPRRIVELIQTVEKALQDLSDLGDTGAIKNPLVTKSIESKLPDTLKKEWLMFAADRRNAVGPGNRFDSLLAFLKEQEAIYEQLEHLREEEPKRDLRPELRDPRPEPRHARTRTSKSNDAPAGCVVCGDGRHRRKLYFCKQFRALNAEEKNAAVERLGACERCLELHDGQEFCKPTYLCKHPDCMDGSHPEHHYYLCPNTAVRFSAASKSSTHPKTGRKGYTADQENFISKLPPEMAEQCRHVFSNSASKTLSTVTTPSSLLAQHGLQELPVLMMLLEVTANAGQQIGTLIDLASDTNYITHKAARRLNLKSEEVTLVVHGVGGMTFRVATRRYLLKIRVKTQQGTLQSHQLVCYGLDNIADVHKGVVARKLQRFFPDVPVRELERPKQIDLLISHREGKLAPQRIRVVGDLVLWDGPLGKTVGGAHPDLFENVVVSARTSNTHFARSMRTAASKCAKECPARFPKQQLPITPSHKNVQESATFPPVQKVLTGGQEMASDICFSHLKATAANMGCVLNAGGLKLKPWMCSGQSGRQESPEEPNDRARALPNQMGGRKGKLHVMTSVSSSKREAQLGPNQTLNRPKWEAVSSSSIILLRDGEDAGRNLVHAAQDAAKFSSTATEVLVSGEQGTGLLICGAEVQCSKHDYAAVPLLLGDPCVRTLPARGSNALARTPEPKVSRKAWPTRGMRVWWKARRKRGQQAMTDLPTAGKVKSANLDRNGVAVIRGCCPEMSGG